MNRRFMEFMREYHPDAANQRFKMTVISEDFFSLASLNVNWLTKNNDPK